MNDDSSVILFLLRGLLLAAGGYAWLLFICRVAGLRALSKMTNFDFVVTVSVGSLLANTVTVASWGALAQTLAGIAGLFTLQWFIDRLRSRRGRPAIGLENEPCLLMRNGEFVDDALEQTRVTRADVIAKLREANVLAFSDVRAVVLETTGEISVLHGGRLDDALLEGIGD